MGQFIEEGPAPRPATGHEGMGKHRVLVVDDNRDIAVTCSRLLEFEGHEVAVAFDGLQALEVARAFRPD
jgi:CheY-like chemotaxis protein